MDASFFLSVGICGLITIGLWAALSRVFRSRENWDDRLDVLRMGLRERKSEEPEAPEGESQVSDLVQKVVPRLSSVLDPKDRVENQKLRLRLSHAGFNSAAAVPAYLALKTLSMGACALIGGAAGSFWGDVGRNALPALVFGAAAGLLLPDLVLSVVIKRRQERIFLTLPDALDLLVVCVEVGQGLDAALKDVCREMGKTAPDLCEEFELYSKQVFLGRPQHVALHELGMRAGVKDLHALAMVIVQAKRFGTSIADTLRELSDGMRIKRRQLAEERAQKTAVQMLFPLVLFIFPGVFMVLVGPAAISVFRDMITVR